MGKDYIELQMTVRRRAKKRKPIVNPLTLRLNPETDADILDYLEALPNVINRSELLRAALREYITNNPIPGE